MNEEAHNSLRLEIRDMMSEKRYLHTLGVEREMRRMAPIFAPNEVERAALAGLLHDVTKAWKSEEQIAYCLQNGLAVTEEEKAAPQILHAKTAAHYIKQKWSLLVDDGILSAIAKHTTGSVEMTTLDKMLYIADFIEEGRTYDSCLKLREEFWSGAEEAKDKERFLDEMLLRAYTLSLEALVRMKAVISPETVLAKEALAKLLAQE